MFGPSMVPREVYASRTGVMARKFSELATSKGKPLEECGLRTVLKRLVMLTCDDGSNPFAGDLRAAHASRSGSIGPGGRCDNIIDAYTVKCPERTYEVHADLYFCTEGVAEMFQ
jgi:phage-related baseplate assembly protein